MSAFYDNLATTFGVEKTMEIAMEAAAWIQKMKDAAEPPVLYGPHQLWSMADCRSHCTTGKWAEEATENSRYGMNMHVRTPSNSMEVALASGETVNVCKSLYEVAMGIKVGDELLMADKFRGRVFKGVVLEESVVQAGDSFQRSVVAREVAAGYRRDLATPPAAGWSEVVFPKVAWQDIGPVTREWNAYLRATTIRPTVVKLTTPPPF